ncbi:recQ-mediated genome instability protein 1-like isoform X2 [Belonocnema kinseyi]|uniref:recQ-mediated genome instability protein 1-like isoform X2 n=1 Tax=Belonocnema kinseyi TaxID=2817044 RepID=UPI00143CC166|nr:recQ-mediated genome instability protein 1-like isoform X2 [Belonocnema kinseyi]
MTENVLTRVKYHMKSQSFSVNDFWLRECVEYFISTHPQARAEAVQTFVQEQFLLTDLREINNDSGCLPPNLAQQHKTTLNGKYTLQDSLFPGLKLMIIGPVVCRRGVILLEETNITLKGGEVEDLLIPNALENVLARELKMPLNPDPYDDTKAKKKETLNDLEDDFNFDLEEIEKIERSQETIEALRPSNLNQNSLQPPINSNSNSNLNSNSNSSKEVQKSNEIPENLSEFPTDDDFADFDLEEVVSAKNIENQNFKAPSETNLTRNFEVAKSSTSANFPAFSSDDFGEDFDLADVDFEAEEEWDEPMELPKINNNSKPVSSFGTDSGFRKPNLEVTTGSKRTAGDLSPLSVSNSKVRCAQSTPKISKINRKITDFVKNSGGPTEKLPEKICDYISDLLKEALTEQPRRKTVRGKVSQIGKLTKKNLLWILDGTIVDESGSIDVEFSSEFLEKIVGMSVSEFSQKKKKIKTDPRMEEQLRKQMLDGQQKLQSMDSLMELELKRDKKPVVLSSRELTQNEKNDYIKRFRMLNA